jgi:hypothetical protein
MTAQEEIALLRAALVKVIEEADGYCDDDYGHPAYGLNAERSLAGLPLIVDDPGRM